MKKTLKPGIEHEFVFLISDKKIVPALYPEAEEFQMMPHVLATGYMVGLIEWACIQAINPYINWPEEMTVGTHINVSHIAATPPTFNVHVHVKVLEVVGRKLVFNVEARDDMDLISQGTHERYIIHPLKFNQKVSEKALRKK